MSYPRLVAWGYVAIGAFLLVALVLIGILIWIAISEQNRVEP
jgi:hypothetical protein